MIRKEISYILDMIRGIRNIWLRIKKAIELNRDNDFTIVEYFRKLGAQIGKNNKVEVRW